MSTDAILKATGELVRLIIETTDKKEFEGVEPADVGGRVLGLWDACLDAVSEGVEHTKDVQLERHLDRQGVYAEDEEDDELDGSNLPLEQQVENLIVNIKGREILTDPDFVPLFQRYLADRRSLAGYSFGALFDAGALLGRYTQAREEREVQVAEPVAGNAPALTFDDFEVGPEG